MRLAVARASGLAGLPPRAVDREDLVALRRDSAFVCDDSTASKVLSRIGQTSAFSFVFQSSNWFIVVAPIHRDSRSRRPPLGTLRVSSRRGRLQKLFKRLKKCYFRV